MEYLERKIWVREEDDLYDLNTEEQIEIISFLGDSMNIICLYGSYRRKPGYY